jgi:hypothetical protein
MPIQNLAKNPKNVLLHDPKDDRPDKVVTLVWQFVCHVLRDLTLVWTQNWFAGCLTRIAASNPDDDSPAPYILI